MSRASIAAMAGGLVWLQLGIAAGAQSTNLAPPFPAWIATTMQTNSLFGVSAGAAGDVNGDGFDDVIVGAPRFTDTLSEEGAAFVYHGSPKGLSSDPMWSTFGGQRYADFGICAAPASDVNRDGYDDVFVGAKAYTFRSGEYDVGAVFLYLGSPSGLARDPAWTAEGPQSGAQFGYRIAGAGDVNGDGFEDLIVTAPRFQELDRRVGRVFLYYGSARGYGAEPNWQSTGEQDGARFAEEAAFLGDVNGDGFGDVIFGARAHDTVRQDAGKVFVFYGSKNGLGTAADWTFEGTQTLGHLGESCSGAGDVNNDGFDDVIVGAPGEMHGSQREGAVYVFYGSRL